MAKLRKLAEEILERYPDKFTTDFEHNKRALEEIAIVRSKSVRNQLAGYIASYLRKASKGQGAEEVQAQAPE